MRAKVARALALDRATMNLARRIRKDIERPDNELSARSWNTAIEHRAPADDLRDRRRDGVVPARGRVVDREPHGDGGARDDRADRGPGR